MDPVSQFFAASCLNFPPPSTELTDHLGYVQKWGQISIIDYSHLHHSAFR